MNAISLSLRFDFFIMWVCLCIDKKKLNECVYGIVGKSAGDATIARAHHTRARARLFLTISRVCDVCLCECTC